MRKSYAYGLPTDGGTSTVDAAELAAIDTYWEENYYADSDIQYTFETAAGEFVNCIDFSAQHSVKSLVAQGLSPGGPPSSPPTPPPGIQPPNIAPQVCPLIPI